MLCFWGSKGGAGCSVVAAATAIGVARRAHTLLVDVDGDLPALLGVEATRPGVADWLTADDPPPDALARCEVVVGSTMSLLPWGGAGGADPAAADADRWEVLARWLRLDGRRVVVDLGTLGARSGRPDVGRLRLALLADRTLLVLRACYLAVVASFDGPRPDGLVVVREPGRALRDRDLSDAIGAPVAATLPWDPAVGRAVDAGLLVQRLPRPLRPLVDLLTAPATVLPASADPSAGARR